MTFAFSRDGASRATGSGGGSEQAPHADLVGAVRDARARSSITMPALLRRTGRHAGRVLRGHVDHHDRPLHRLHDPGVPALADGRQFQPGPWTLGRKYKWINLVAIVWVALNVIIFSLPFDPRRRVRRQRLQLDGVNYAPLVNDRRDRSRSGSGGSAHKTFKGPVRTVDDPDVERARTVRRCAGLTC